MNESAPTLLLSRPLPDLFVNALQSLGDVHVGDEKLDDAIWARATVYVAVGVDPVPADLIRRFPEGLGLIANIATGTDNIDLTVAAERGIQVSNTPVVAEDTADLAMALLLSACRRLSVCERALRAGDWAAGASQLGSRVHGKTLGIIGMGAIGQAMARRAAGFGMTVLYHGPNQKPAAEATLGVQFRSELDALLAEADIVSLHCPLTDHNHHLINKRSLALMKPGAVLINTGRGSLVDEQALITALADGHLGAAGLDVFEFEPEVSEGLLDFDNVCLLPHIGSATVECRTDMALRAFENVKQYITSGTVPDPCI